MQFESAEGERREEQEMHSVMRLFAFHGVLGPVDTMSNHNTRSGLFIPSWAFSMIASVALFLSGMAVAYVKFEAITEQRLSMLEGQIKQLQQDRDRDWRELRDLVLELKKKEK